MINFVQVAVVSLAKAAANYEKMHMSNQQKIIQVLLKSNAYCYKLKISFSFSMASRQLKSTNLVFLSVLL